MRVLPALCLIAAAPLVANAQDAADQPDFSDMTPQECALVENGVKRLACYDALTNPPQVRAQATEEEIEEANSATDPLGFQPSDDADTDAISNGDVETDENSQANSLVSRYLAAERALFSFSGSFLTHRPTYILPYTYVHEPNQRPYSPRTGYTDYDNSLDYDEAKYQISFKVPLLTGVFDEKTTLWFGYTQLSFWQLFNDDGSKPFRETNYEPEIFVRYASQWDFGPGRVEALTLGINHQSNGQSEPKSRSWNRILGGVAYSYDRWLFMVQPWYRIPEDEDEDDNPNIENYMGYANYWAVYKVDEQRTLSLKLLNNLKADENRTSVQVGYSFPLGETVKGYVHYYNGYGESLIDYNERIQRIGIGIMLNDWL
ncbi:phospholipase A [Marinobacter nanhaiticus D15-8W]|uniref:Phospholipase A1 n=1 Tax=Marinobacter nanhaiticus D15-8W TaxID=626887 RepID=N6WTC2_9GAMM|nr:phospholipase A [Marinobacter nanhaiticus]ENO14726.1 phospholipase [Marinobacter nanhaiticus D15-8W]BES69586.1 phospholipase A [Marinobacter nanhaiticus D15-8W]